MNTTHAFKLGQKVIAQQGVSAPHYFNTTGLKVRAYKGEVVELLIEGSFSVKFEGYDHAWDYSAREAKLFLAVDSFNAF